MQIGYLHRGFEKMCERGTWTQVFPYVDRLQLRLADAQQRRLRARGREAARHRGARALPVLPRDPRRARAHLAITSRATARWPWSSARSRRSSGCIKAREMIWDILEEETGARLTHSFGRIGGMAKPPTAGFKEHVRATLSAQILDASSTRARSCCSEPHLPRPPRGRRHHLGKDDAIALGVDGPVPARDRRRLRRAQGAPVPACTTRVDFDVPVGHDGDNYDRFMVPPRRDAAVRAHHRRRRSSRCPTTGPINVDDPRIVLPAEGRGLHDHRRHHPALQARDGGRQGPRRRGATRTPKAATASSASTSSRDGSGTPYRVRIRPPCFLITAGLEQLITRRDDRRRRPDASARST